MPRYAEPCEHVQGLQPVSAAANGCQECLALGETWNELRVCLTCGHVGCCEDSTHAHALRHHQATGHPIIASFERGERWGWCYVHRQYFELAAELRPRKRSLLAMAWSRLSRR